MMMSNSFYNYNNIIDIRNSSFGNWNVNNNINNSFNHNFNSNIYQPNINNIQVNLDEKFPFAIKFTTHQKQNNEKIK